MKRFSVYFHVSVEDFFKKVDKEAEEKGRGQTLQPVVTSKEGRKEEAQNGKHAEGEDSEKCTICHKRSIYEKYQACASYTR